MAKISVALDAVLINKVEMLIEHENRPQAVEAFIEAAVQRALNDAPQTHGAAGEKNP